MSSAVAESPEFGFQLADTGLSFLLGGYFRSVGTQPLALKGGDALSCGWGCRRLRNYGFPVKVMLQKVRRSPAVMVCRTFRAALASPIQ